MPLSGDSILELGPLARAPLGNMFSLRTYFSCLLIKKFDVFQSFGSWMLGNMRTLAIVRLDSPPPRTDFGADGYLPPTLQQWIKATARLAFVASVQAGDGRFCTWVAA